MVDEDRAPHEDCDECGYRWDLWSDGQAVDVLALAGPLLGGVLAGVDLELANTRPASDSWSILEYVDHIRHALWIWRFAIDAALAEPGADLRQGGAQAFLAETTRFDDVGAAVGRAGDEGGALQATFKALAPDQWMLNAQIRAGVIDPRWVAHHALHELVHHLHDVGRVRARLGDGVTAQRGSVAQLNLGGGGVPKGPVDHVDVTAAGALGDHQNDGIHHGRPFQALCLYGLEVIDAFRREGHPIFAGAVGENITVAGLDWTSLRPGTVAAIGDEVRIELSAYAVPCAKNAEWFADRDFRRMLHDTNPGRSRIYATVLQPGRVHTGDSVTIEP